MDRQAIIRAESDRFATVLGDCEATAPVPCCPDWDARDLLWHLTEVHCFWTGILAAGATTVEEVKAIDEAGPKRPDTLEEMLSMRAGATDALIAQLRAHDDAERAWSWFDADQTVGFTRRMQTYEAAIHRADAELTAGLPVTPLADELAIGTVDHATEVMWFGWAPDGATYEPLPVVELVALDVDRRWLVQMGHCTGTGEDGEPYDFPRALPVGDGDPVATVAAPVSDLALWAWTRGTDVRMEGNEEGLAAIRAQVDFGIP